MFIPLVVNRGLVLVTGEDTRWHRLWTGCRFCKRVDRFVEAPWDVIELRAVEFVLQPSDFLVVRSHLGVVVA